MANLNATIAQLARGIYTGDNQVNVAEAIKDKISNDDYTIDQIAQWLEDNKVYWNDDLDSLTKAFMSGD